MNIANNILRHYLKNAYFITGTAYAGKSTTAKMLAETKGDPIALCRAVCSPGGSTIEGVKTLENGGVDRLFSDAVEASYKRNIELGK